MNQFTETPRAANHPETFCSINPAAAPEAQTIPPAENVANQLGRVISKSHLSVPLEPPRDRPTGNQVNEATYKRASKAIPHRPRNRRSKKR